MKVISGIEVRRLLPIAECVEVMRAAMRAVSAGTVEMPQRLIMALPDGRGYLALMPASAAMPKVYGAKIVSLNPANSAEGRPAVQGIVVLFDQSTGVPIAVVDGAEVTALRTAAVSALATQYLARTNAATHGVFGTGVQAAAHIEAVNVVRAVSKVIIWGRDFRKASELARAMAERTGIEIQATDRPQDAAACDIMSVVTGAAEPVLLGRWVQDGAHVNLVGAHMPSAREADSDLIAAASVYTDALDSLFSEAGDIIIPIEEGRIERSHIKGEIGSVAGGQLAGRTSDGEITVYKSLGIAAQDLFLAHAIYTKSVAQEPGR